MAHRWSALTLGGLLVLVMTAGVPLLYQPEYFRHTHPALYQHSGSPESLDATEALSIVLAAHPKFDARWVNFEHGIYEVGDADYNRFYGVDPGTGRITGEAHRDGGVMGLLMNFHTCLLACSQYPGYVPVLGEPTFGVKLGNVVLAGCAIEALFLVGSGLRIWWPGLRRTWLGFRLRFRRGRFARDFDLHKVIGLIAIPGLLLWGFTSAVYELPFVHRAWLGVTGGAAPVSAQYHFHAAPYADGPTVSIAQASAVAVQVVPGRVTRIDLPTRQRPYYGVVIAKSVDPYAHSQFPGSGYVCVDSHDATHRLVAAGRAVAARDDAFAQLIRPSHFGYAVDGRWRLIWVGLGLLPLALALTGLSTWLIRHRTRQQRLRRERARWEAAAETYFWGRQSTQRPRWWLP